MAARPQDPSQTTLELPTLGTHDAPPDVRNRDYPTAPTTNPASRLRGYALEGGWTVGDLIDTDDYSATGGHHSFAYHVRHPEHGSAFLKALNLEAQTGHSNHADRMKFLLDLFVFERDILTECSGYRLSRITQLWASGEAAVPSNDGQAIVPYLILEIAEGDIRRHQDQSSEIDLPWCLRTLKHVCVGVQQLHGRPRVAHQDLKPSNVLTHAAGRDMKLGDLGRAERIDGTGPNADSTSPGDITYAPPEQLYGAFDRRWESRCLSDIYQIGSMISFLFVGHGATALLTRSLPHRLRFRQYQGTFDDVLPELCHAHSTVVQDVTDALSQVTWLAGIREPLLDAFQELAFPDPARRGHPRNAFSGIPQADVQRYISLFDRLEKRATYHHKRGNSCLN